MIRRRYLAPSSLEIKYAIRALTITLHTKPSKKSSYEAVNYQTKWLTELKDIRRVEEMKKTLADKEDDIVNVITGNIDFKSFAEESALCYGVGYVLEKTIGSKSHCKICKERLFEAEGTVDVQEFITRKSFVPGALRYPTPVAFHFFSHCEGVFVKNDYAIRRGNEVLDKVLEHLEKIGVEQYGIPKCHIRLLLDRFFKFRMYLECRQMNLVMKAKQIEEAKKKKDKRIRIYASKSASGHAQR